MALSPSLLIIAGTDSSGGAGISRDLVTAAHFALTTALAVTAITAQTNQQVVQIYPTPPSLIAAQIACAFATHKIGSIKIGMIGTNQAIYSIAHMLRKYPACPVIFDPVLAASSEDPLILESVHAFKQSLIQYLLPLITLMTPNLNELALLTDSSIANEYSQALTQARILLDYGARAILVKGGHFQQTDQAIDVLLTAKGPPIAFIQPRLNSAMRGTGCALSTAISAYLLSGFPLEKAIDQAKSYVFSCLKTTML